jgi:hypothetical protein
MQKLLDAACNEVLQYRDTKNPMKALDRLAAYDRKHPFARILLSPSDQHMVQMLIGDNQS